MTSALELVDRTIDDFLMTGQRVLRAKLNAGVTSATVSIELKQNQGALAEGQLLQANFELMEVWSATGQTVVVERGDYGTTAVDHSANAIVEVDPIFPRSRVLRSLQSAATSLSGEPGIWKPLVVEFTPVSGTEVYDLGTTEVRNVVAVDQLVHGDWVPLDYAWELVRGLTGQTGITGDVGLRLNYYQSLLPVRVICEAPLGAIDETTADVETTVGLENATILAVGAALELNAGRAIKRSFIEGAGDSRRANEVAPYQTENSSRELRALYKQLVGQAVTRLSQLYPHKRKRR